MSIAKEIDSKLRWIEERIAWIRRNNSVVDPVTRVVGKGMAAGARRLLGPRSSAWVEPLLNPGEAIRELEKAAAKLKQAKLKGRLGRLL